MKKATRSTYKKDIIAQCSYPVMMGCYLLGILIYLSTHSFFNVSRLLMLAVVFQLMTSIAQCISACLHFLFYRSKIHLNFVLFSCFYACFLFFSIEKGINSYYGNFYLFLAIFLIPSCASGWYYYRTISFFKNSKIEQKDIDKALRDDVLDDNMLAS